MAWQEAAAVQEKQLKEKLRLLRFTQMQGMVRRRLSMRRFAEELAREAELQRLQEGDELRNAAEAEEQDRLQLAEETRLWHLRLQNETTELLRLEAAREREAEEQRKEEQERLQREAEEQARHEEQARLQREAEEQARKEEQARLQREAEEQARKEEQARLQREAEEQARKEEQARLQREAEEQARHEEQARLQREAEEQAGLEQLRLEEEDRERARLEAERELAMRCVQMQGMLRRVLAMHVFHEDRLKHEAEEEARKHAAREAAAREWKIQSAAKAEFPKFLKTRIVELMVHPKNKGVSFTDLEARLYTELLHEITARIEAEEEGGAPIQPQLPSIARQGGIDPKRPKAKAVTPTTHCTTKTFRLGSLHRGLGSELAEPLHNS